MSRSALLARTFTAVRDCAWLDAGRARAYARILASVAIAVSLAWIALGSDGLDRRGEPLGGDFVSFWAAARLALEGQPERAYDIGAHWAQQKAMFGPDVGYAAFFYPPPALLLYLPLGFAPYFVALSLWLGLGGYAAFQAARGFWAGLDAVTFLAFPAVLVNVAHGQNGFVTTALIGGGLLALGRRPAVAGALLGAMVIKPHLALVLPFALVLSRRWTTLCAAAATSLALCALSLAAFGVSTWRSFLHGSSFARRALEENLIGYEKMQSVFAAARLLHGSVGIAWILQAASAGAALAALFSLYRKGRPQSGEAAAVVCAALLATPFLLDYDLMLLAIPMCWMTAEGLRRGFLPFEKAALAAVFLLPLISRSVAGTLGAPLAPFLIAALMGLVMRRADEPVVDDAVFCAAAAPRASHLAPINDRKRAAAPLES